MVDDGPVGGNFRNGAGDTALTMGIVAVLFAFVPVIGDFVAVPAALMAISLGLIGVRRAEQGLASNPGQAVGGTILGATAASVLMILFIATVDRID